MLSPLPEMSDEESQETPRFTYYPLSKELGRRFTQLSKISKAGKLLPPQWSKSEVTKRMVTDGEMEAKSGPRKCKSLRDTGDSRGLSDALVQQVTTMSTEISASLDAVLEQRRLQRDLEIRTGHKYGVLTSFVKRNGLDKDPRRSSSTSNEDNKEPRRRCVTEQDPRGVQAKTMRVQQTPKRLKTLLDMPVNRPLLEGGVPLDEI